MHGGAGRKVRQGREGIARVLIMDGQMSKNSADEEVYRRSVIQ